MNRMSHDIRTPINGIMGMVDIIRKNRNDWEKVDDSLEKIRLSTKHLLELVSDVLDMSKLEAGMFEIEEDTFDMSELMDEVAALVDAQKKHSTYRTVWKLPAAASYYAESSEQCDQIQQTKWKD